MLKRLILILTLIVTFTLSAANAADNFLNSVVLEKGDDGFNIILRSDNTAKVKKSSQSSDKIVLTLQGITTSSDFNTMYKNTPDINNIIVENADAATIKFIFKHQIFQKQTLFLKHLIQLLFLLLTTLHLKK